MRYNHISRVLVLSLAVVLPWLVFAESGGYPSGSTNPYPAQEGQLCSPPFGYRRKRCGGETVIAVASDPRSAQDYGPNVCTVTRTVVTLELEYRYRRSCSWVYSHDHYRWIRQCNLICAPTSVCDESVNSTYNRTSVECCEGFTTRPQHDRSHQEYYYTQYYIPEEAEPEGCPVAVADSLIECLELHNLTMFSGFVNLFQFANMCEFWDLTDMEVTLFIPTNAALEGIDVCSLGLDMFNMLVGNHVVRGTEGEEKLRNNVMFVTLAGTHLHSTTVQCHDSSHYGHSYSQPRVLRFISGAQIVSKEACKVPNATFHIIDRVLMPGNGTIAEVLTSDPRFSILEYILNVVGILRFLHLNDVFRTLFAPTNEVIMREWPPDLLQCLKDYMQAHLKNILLYHISDRVEYDSSLKLQTSLPTLLHRSHLRVHPSDNGDIFLGGDVDSRLVHINETNIPALNGVVHVLDGIVIPPNFDYGMCQQFVPTQPPPEPSPSPSPSPSFPTSSFETSTPLPLPPLSQCPH